jgi:predicted nucleic acid-binding protein
VILIDTSAWIEFFRDRGATAELVDAALREDEAAWCGPIATELRRGLRSPKGVPLELVALSVDRD